MPAYVRGSYACNLSEVEVRRKLQGVGNGLVLCAIAGPIRNPSTVIAAISWEPPKNGKVLSNHIARFEARPVAVIGPAMQPVHGT